MKTLFFICLFLVVSFESFSQHPDLPPNAEAGKCYAKSFYNDYRIVEKKVFRYLGDRKKAKYIQRFDYHVLPGYGLFLIDEKMKSTIGDKIEINDEKQTIILVTDTTKTNNFSPVKAYTIEYSENYDKWFEVICKRDLDKTLITKIQEELKNSGLYIGLIDGKYNEETKNAITKFQLENELEFKDDLISIEMLKLLKIE